jgi:hypothetical protein
MPTRRRDLVSRATRTAFRTLATNLTVRTISEAWQSQNFAPVPEDELRYTDTSVRRTTFESYVAAVDWSDRGHVTRALRVFEDIIRTGRLEDWSGQWLDDLVAVLQHDGLQIDGSGRITEVPGTWAPHAQSQVPKQTGRGAPAITEVTRRRIFELLRGTDWTGGMGDLRFLARLYDLDAMPSYDSRFATAGQDISQHRYNNPDWEDDWIFSDDRFGLQRGPDETLLRFLAETLHPAVRTDTDEVARLLTALNEVLSRDAFALAPAGVISGYPVYQARRLEDTPATGRQKAGVAPSPKPAQIPAVGTSSIGQSPASSLQTAENFLRVRDSARGDRKDYACERLPFADGGQADVFRATHKSTGTLVVLKKLRGRYPSERQKARMRREITVG